MKSRVLMLLAAALLALPTISVAGDTIELPCHGCTSIGGSGVCDANGGVTGKKEMCYMTPDGSGGYLCSWSGGPCMTLAYADIPADLAISAAGTYNAPTRPVTGDGALVMDACAGFVVDVVEEREAPSRIALQ